MDGWGPELTHRGCRLPLYRTLVVFCLKGITPARVSPRASFSSSNDVFFSHDMSVLPLCIELHRKTRISLSRATRWYAGASLSRLHRRSGQAAVRVDRPCEVQLGPLRIGPTTKNPQTRSRRVRPRRRVRLILVILTTRTPWGALSGS